LFFESPSAALGHGSHSDDCDGRSAISRGPNPGSATTFFAPAPASNSLVFPGPSEGKTHRAFTQAAPAGVPRDWRASRKKGTDGGVERRDLREVPEPPFRRRLSRRRFFQQRRSGSPAVGCGSASPVRKAGLRGVNVMLIGPRPNPRKRNVITIWQGSLAPRTAGTWPRFQTAGHDDFERSANPGLRGRSVPCGDRCR